MPNPADRPGNQGPSACATRGCRTRATTINYMKNTDNSKSVYTISTLHDSGGWLRPSPPSRPDPESGQRPPAPRAAASRPPAGVPLPSAPAAAAEKDGV
jgi:hypothetical protein